MMLFLFIGALSSRAEAMFEARLTYSILTSSPDLAAVYTGAPTEAPAASPNYGLGLDAVFVIPGLGIGAGLRHENLGFKTNNGDLEYKSSATRTALLVNLRIINSLFFLGPIATYGLSHSNNMKWTLSGTTANLEPESSSSSSIGLEAGVTWGGFLLGVEAGTETLKWNKMRDQNEVVNNGADLDMSGPYVKALLGFTI